jgi:hypothetical protein
MMASVSETENVHEARLVWPGDLPVVVALNQVATQVTRGPSGAPGEIIMTVGHAAPPLLVGDPEEQRAQAQAVDEVPVQVLGRFSMGREQVGQMLSVLATAAEQWDRQAAVVHNGREGGSA